jgi:RimJ/RimL family protein N-acetyltransferase
LKRILDKPEDYQRIADFVCERIAFGRKTDNFTAIGLESDGKLVAGVIYSEYNGNNISAGIAGEGNWLTREFLWFMFYYPFIQAGAQRITACVETNNLQSQRFVEKLGFELEFSMKRAGRFGDLLIYRMFREDCKYLERHYESRQKFTTSRT